MPSNKSVIWPCLDLLMTILPPGLIVCLSTGSIIGMKRLGDKDIILNTFQLINGAGRMQVVMFDKTGTLTTNGMKLVKVYVAISDKDDVPQLKHIDSLNSKMQDSEEVYNLMFNFSSNHTLAYLEKDILGDPMEEELFDYAQADIANLDERKTKDCEIKAVSVPYKNGRKAELVPERVFAFVPELQRMSIISRNAATRRTYLFSKGSPEMILKLCRPDSVPEDTKKAIKFLTNKGLRVLAHAFKEFDAGNYSDATREELEIDLVFQGLSTFENPLKATTKDSIRRLKANDIYVGMITGDNLFTAQAIAKTSGIIAEDESAWIYTFENGQFTKKNMQNGSVVKVNRTWKSERVGKNDLEVSSSSDKEVGVINREDMNRIIAHLKLNVANCEFDWKNPILLEIARKVRVFSRMNPDQKGIIVRIIKSYYNKQSQYVGYCGDGANDVVAIKESDIGISLSEDESSMSAPFLSFIPDITCVEHISTLGKASLTTGFDLFRYFLIMSIGVGVGLLILYSRRVEYGQVVYYVTDFAIMMNLSTAMSYIGDIGHLTKDQPKAGLFNRWFVLSASWQIVVFIVVQVVIVQLVIKDSSYIDPGVLVEAELALIKPGEYTFFVGASEILYYIRSSENTVNPANAGGLPRHVRLRVLFEYLLQPLQQVQETLLHFLVLLHLRCHLPPLHTLPHLR